MFDMNINIFFFYIEIYKEICAVRRLCNKCAVRRLCNKCAVRRLCNKCAVRRLCNKCAVRRLCNKQLMHLHYIPGKNH
jgi:hypothetical protein